VPVIVVGGGAPLCGDALPGATRIIRPQYASVANAVGAAIPQVLRIDFTFLHSAAAFLGSIVQYSCCQARMW
jgi:hypothetical protein